MSLIRAAVRRFADERISSPEPDVVYDEYGKPFLPGVDIYVSVSHSGEYCGCAVSASPVGFDIERIRELPYEKIIKRFCAPEEYAYLTSVGNTSTCDRPENECRKRFFEIWTLKESYVKYMGKGFRIPLNSFSVASKEGLHAELDGIELIILDALPGYGMGLCVKENAKRYVEIVKG